MTRILSILLLTLSLQAATTPLIGPESNFTQSLKTKGTADAWRKALQVDNQFDARWFGAVGDGVTDDTASIQAAYDAACAAGGGTIVLPIPSECYRFNIVITNDNVRLDGRLPNVSSEKRVLVKAKDLTKPVIQVGDDTGLVYGTHISNIGFSCTNSATGIKFAGGSVQSIIENCTFIGGTNVLAWWEAGANYPCTQNNAINCDFWDNPTGTCIRIKYPKPGSYTTAINFFGCRVHSSHKTADYALEVDRGQALTIYGGYFDMTPNHAVHILNGSRIQGFGTRFDNQASPGLVTIDWTGDVNPDYDLSRYLEGSFELLGGVTWIDGTNLINTVQTLLSRTNAGSIVPPYYGYQRVGGFELHSKPYIIGDTKLGTVKDPGTFAYGFGVNAVQGTPNAGIVFFRVDANGEYSGEDVRIVANGTNGWFVVNPGKNIPSRLGLNIGRAVTNAAVTFFIGDDTQTTGTSQVIITGADGTTTPKWSVNMKTGSVFSQPMGLNAPQARSTACRSPRSCPTRGSSRSSSCEIRSPSPA